MERFVYRNEPSVIDPTGNPVRGILLDREESRYNLLDSRQKDTVLEAVHGKIAGKELKAKKPFDIAIDLTELEGNTKVIETIDSPPVNILSAPITVYFEVSPKCNLNCRDCYQGCREDTKDNLSTDEVESAIKKFSEIGVFIVRFTGKEPTVHPDLLKFIDLGKNIGLKMALNTNGFFEEGVVSGLIDAGIKEVVVSLDGNQEWNDGVRGKGVYNRAVEALSLFSKAGIDTRINMTVSKGNIEYLEYVAALAHRLGCYVSYIPMRNLGNASEEMLNELLNSNEMEQIARIVTSLRAKYSPTRLLTYFDIVAEESDYYHPMFQMTPCHARKNIFMTNKGDVFPCDHLVALGDLFKGGNIREKELLNIWKEGKGLQKYRSLEHNNKCLGCNNFGKKCHGGCPSEALVASGGEETKIVSDRLCFC